MFLKDLRAAGKGRGLYPATVEHMVAPRRTHTSPLAHGCARVQTRRIFFLLVPPYLAVLQVQGNCNELSCCFGNAYYVSVNKWLSVQVFWSEIWNELSEGWMAEANLIKFLHYHKREKKVFSLQLVVEMLTADTLKYIWWIVIHMAVFVVTLSFGMCCQIYQGSCYNCDWLCSFKTKQLQRQLLQIISFI